MSLLDKYNKLCIEPSDINEHLPLLKEYASKCKHITEFGMRYGVSTSALLMGMPETYIGYDIRKHPKVDEFEKEAIKNNIDFTFKLESSIDENVEIDETEFLFIDTFHHYDQLKKELELHADKVSKYIGFHDTVSHAKGNERFEAWHGMIPRFKESGKKGILPAINDFLSTNPWKIVEDRKNNNGLMIIERVN